jgi:hypothetical protein
MYKRDPLNGQRVSARFVYFMKPHHNSFYLRTYRDKSRATRLWVLVWERAREYSVNSRLFGKRGADSLLENSCVRLWSERYRNRHLLLRAKLAR